MKINPDQIESVRRQQEQNKSGRISKDGNAFGDLLSQEVAKASASEGSKTAQAPAPLMGVNPLLQMQQVEKATPVGQEQQVIASQVDGALSKLENFAKNLEAPSGLKQAHSALEELTGDLEAMKEKWPDLAEKHPELGAVVNELEVLSVTERFKFNRGDYQ
ncbi:MAG: hypothetical protein ACNI27_01865 [Desulfovibrio sp.]